MLIAITSLFIIHLLAVMSPGPDFAMTTRNSLVHGRSAGVLTALGITAGNFIHIAYVTAGFAVILVNSPLAYNTVMAFGGFYLLYFAYLCVKPLFTASHGGTGETQAADPKRFLLNGFVTNVTNVKCSLYYIAIASRFMAPSVSSAGKVVFAAEMILVTVFWFSFVAFVLTDKRLRGKFMSKRKFIDAAFAAVITVLGIVMIADAAGGFASEFHSRT